ncbi:lysophospholipid acyltransferase family protein [Piscinibacter koreensis]|uniref:1-acyl-sn-glycerol-3-phosphate acyltransferase n=1 Tax=Piscinibacter koreensis TaxID=2742824 RepID=A0A7Y6NPQ9_9BURK|nr:lysophospholipid acyltransferase family protein [Schlegelella koreensis]NUZ07050.1 1-acyl-sn-glycerol-3-phosphate acyltransferase [Schlegelella koreensis]
MRRLRAVWRLARAIAEALGGAVICLVVFPWIDAAARRAHVARWSRRVLGVLGVRLEVSGTPAAGPVLLVANHVSWLDILAIDATEPARFVAKAALRRWPMLGRMAAAGGTLFIEREKKRDALRVVHQVAAALGHGDRVAVFAEGTTSDGRQLLPFHANLLQSAVASGVALQPVALRYADAAGAFSAAAPYVDDMTLVESAWRIAAAEGLIASVTYLPPLPTRGADRRLLAAASREAIADALGLAPGD